MTPLEAEALIPIAAELIACVRDYGPDDTAEVLARVPDGRHDALAVVLAAMVNPDARPTDLLAWTTQGPVRSRDDDRFTPRHLTVAAMKGPSVAEQRRTEVARMTALGLSAEQIADRIGVEKRSVYRIRRGLSKARESA